MSSKIVERIVKQSGFPALANFLANNLSPSDLQSLLLHVQQRRAAQVTEAELMRASERSLVKAADIDARLFHLFDQVAFATAREFEAIDLSPVSPFGVNKALGDIDQNNVLSTVRNSDVIGDPTVVMALECARRRRSNPAVVRLCNSHRVVRLQSFDDPDFRPHFRLFSMVTAGRDTGSRQFETGALIDHLRFYLLLFRNLNEVGFVLSNPLVELSDASLVQRLIPAAMDDRSVRAHVHGGSERFLEKHRITLPEAVPELAYLERDVFNPLMAEFPEAQFRLNLGRLEGVNYYSGVMLRISPMSPDGQRYAIADGGFTNWTARLLQNRKERLLTSGIGAEFACRRYASAGA